MIIDDEPLVASTDQPPQLTTTTTPTTTPPAVDRAAKLDEDKVKTFKLLLEALYVDTRGVMSTLQGKPGANVTTGMLSDMPFPVCYPLSPNSASLLGFRKLLLHRRKLDQVVKVSCV